MCCVKFVDAQASIKLKYMCSKKQMEPWCSLVNTLPCQGRDREFESRRLRHLKKIPAVRRDFYISPYLEHFPSYTEETS